MDGTAVLTVVVSNCSMNRARGHDPEQVAFDGHADHCGIGTAGHPNLPSIGAVHHFLPFERSISFERSIGLGLARHR